MRIFDEGRRELLSRQGPWGESAAERELPEKRAENARTAALVERQVATIAPKLALEPATVKVYCYGKLVRVVRVCGEWVCEGCGERHPWVVG